MQSSDLPGDDVPPAPDSGHTIPPDVGHGRRRISVAKAAIGLRQGVPSVRAHVLGAADVSGPATCGRRRCHDIDCAKAVSGTVPDVVRSRSEGRGLSPSSPAQNEDQEDGEAKARREARGARREARGARDGMLA